MSESVIVNKILVGGIPVDVHSHRDGSNSSLPVHALFLLHGRTLSTESVVPIAKSILEASYAPGVNRKRDLIIIAYDHRNHGRRLVDPLRNQGWHKDPAKNNPQHAVDMYTIQTGTAHDLTFLIDHIPAYIYPQVERNIVEWGAAGTSLGGHSVWIALTRDPRIQLAIPIIGCPDYTKLISQRAQICGVPLEAPHYPLHLKAYVDAYDPASFAFRENDATNPFLGKRILVLSGAKDTLVPWSASQEFVEGLEVGDGVKKVVLEENAGHECTPSMIREAGLFVIDWLAK
ncbi:Alpha/Beta hydrolase protein [Boletus edulis BED1]|uniref:Alpha/Beta hydrolase protein n=1 Tax=Boletus edulis BED1 TaxID=1328754 RepID=A0AAD4GB10_BOLED|nr:Alpha/Beta hydrolase protein [Boletus edulis BED1]